MRYGLGVLVWCALMLNCSQAETQTDEAKAAILIEKLGGKVSSDPFMEGMPVVEVVLPEAAAPPALTHLKRFHHLRRLSVVCGKLKDVELRSVSQLPELHFLELGDVSDAGLKEMGKLPKLVYLAVSGPNITNAGLVHLQQLEQLKTISLYKTPRIGDVGLQHLARIPGLEHVELRGTSATGEGVRRLQEALPKAKIARSDQ